MEQIQIGSILQQLQNNTPSGSGILGVVISKANQSPLLVFRLVDKIHPVFSKITWNPAILSKCGHINELPYSDLKSELLKYYRTRHLSEKEQSILNPIMLEAFPLGIPLYDSKVPVVSPEMRNLSIGSKILLNTMENSANSALDGESAFVVDMQPNGIWIAKPTGDIQHNFLFYGSPDKSQFAGISRLRILEDSASDVFQRCLESYNAMESPIANLIVNEERIKVDPKTLNVVYPLSSANNQLMYNPANNSIFTQSRESPNSHAHSHFPSPSASPSPYHSPSILIMEDDEDELNDSKSFEQSGGAKGISKEARKRKDSSDSDDSIESVEPIAIFNEDDVERDDMMEKLNLHVDDSDDEDIPALPKSSEPTESKEPEFEVSDADEDDNAEYDSEVFQSDEETLNEGESSDIEVLEVIKKIERVPKPEESKIFKDDLQKSELYSMTLEHIPVFLRADERLQNVIRKKINYIIKLKNQLLTESGELQIPNENTRPLVDAYMSGDFRNRVLIPLVINSKKIYIDGGKSKVGEDSFDSKNHFVISKYVQEITDINYLVENRKRNTHIDQDTLIQSIINIIAPTKNLDKEYGLVLRLGQGVGENDIANLSLDALTLRYCEKPFACQSFEGMRESLDYSVALGPLQRFLSVDDVRITSGDSTILKVYDSVINFKQGEKLDIMGFVRLPLSGNGHINDIYKNHEIRKIPLDSDEVPNMLEHPNDIIMYIVPESLKLAEDVEVVRELMNKMIPTATEILRHYETRLSDTPAIERILAKYGYKLNELNPIAIQTLTNIQTRIIHNYKKKLDLLQAKFNKSLESKPLTTKPSKSSNFLITDEILEEIEKLYEHKYIDHGLEFDSDSNRFQWISSHVDQGKFIYYYLLHHYYRNTDLEGSLTKQSELLKLAQQQLDVLFVNKKILATEIEPEQVEQCHVQMEHIPRIVRYQNEALLIADNNNEITDINGNIILEGDFAIIKSATDKQMFIYTRKLVNGMPMWIRENKNVLLRFLELEKQRKAKCNAVDTCVYKEDTGECAVSKSTPPTPLSEDPEIAKIQREVLVYKDEIAYLRNAIKHQKLLSGELKQQRRIINESIQIKKACQKYIEENESKKKVEISGDVVVPIPCAHLTATKFLFSQRNYTPLQEYQVVKAIMRKFQNTELFVNFFVVDKDDGANWVNCNVCGQHLLCKHYLLGLHQIQNTGDLSDTEITDLYGVETTDGFSCKVCGIQLANSEVVEISEFLRGPSGDGRRNVDREIYVETIESISSIEKYIESLKTDKPEETPTELMAVNLYIGLKLLTGISVNISAEDEAEMINYIKSATFTPKDAILRKILREKPNIDQHVALQYSGMVYNQNVCCDISARFLIILQTSTCEYGIENRFCNKNYYGFPLDPDESKDTGIRFITCLFKQLSTDPQFKFLEKDMTRNLLNSIKRHISGDEYIANKLLDTINRKTDKIADISQFEEHYTNYWNGFRPQLRQLPIPPEPEKFLNLRDISDVAKPSIYAKMLETGRFNGDYLSLAIIHQMNRYIEDKNPENRYMYSSIGNTCCLEKIESQYKYFDYFLKGDSLIANSFGQLLIVSEAMKLLTLKTPISWIFPKTLAFPKPSRLIIPLEMKFNADDVRIFGKRFITDGVNSGMEHIYDNFGRCIYSNAIRQDGADKATPTPTATGDFKHMFAKVQQYHVVPPVVDEALLEFDDLKISEDQIRHVIKQMKEASLLEQALGKLMDIWKMGGSEDLRIWTLLNSQIQMDIDIIGNYIFSDSTKRGNIKAILNNLADYNNLYDEQLADDGYESASYQRYKRKEQDIHQVFQFLITAILQVKNGKLAGLKLDLVRPQFQFMFQFRDNAKLFSRIYKDIESFYKASKIIYGFNESKFLNPENSCILLHYLFINALYNIIFGSKRVISLDSLDSETQQQSGGAKPTAKPKQPAKSKQPAKPKPKVVLEDDESDESDGDDGDDGDEILAKEDSAFAPIEIEEEPDDGEDSPQEVNFIKELEISESADSTIIIEFINKFIKHIDHRQSVLNKLTHQFIKLKTTEEREKQERKNLGNLRKLKFTEGLEEQYKLLMIKLQFNQIEYRDLYEEINQELSALNLDKYAETMEINTMEAPEYGIGSDVLIKPTDNEEAILKAREENYMNYNEPMEADYGDGDRNIEDDADFYD